MIRKSFAYIVPLAFTLLLLNSCSFLKEVTAFGKCDFRVTTLENPRLAGVDVSGIQSFGDIPFSQMGAITSSILQGRLPLNFTLNIEARNPNAITAAMNELEYIAMIDDVEVATGSLNQRVEIPANGGVTEIPLQLGTDIIEILQGESRQALVNFGLNLADSGNRPTRVSIKVKPTIVIGAVELQYPGYYKLNYEFSSGD